MSGPDAIILLVKLAVLAAFGAAGAAIAKKKNRSTGLWFVVCFLSTWIGLIVLGCMRKVPVRESAAESAPAVPSEPLAQVAELPPQGELEQTSESVEAVPRPALAPRPATPVFEQIRALWRRLVGPTSRAGDEAPLIESRDDLTLIAGIGEREARQLNAHGVRLYSQIAAWTPADVEQMSAALRLDQRIQHENWIGQAKLLMPRYARCSECWRVYDASAFAQCPRHAPGADPMAVDPFPPARQLEPAQHVAQGGYGWRVAAVLAILVLPALALLAWFVSDVPALLPSTKLEQARKPEPQGPHPLSVAEERALRAGSAFRECDQCPEMLVLPAGEFTMGSPSSEAGRFGSEEPQHAIHIAKQLAIGKFHVTVDQFAAFAADAGHGTGDTCYVYEGGKWQYIQGRSWRDPGFPQNGLHPVVCVSWNDAKAYAAWLSRKTGKPFRLLTEAEWEYAARASTTTRYHFGEDENDLCTHLNGLDQAAKGKIAGAGNWIVPACSDGYAYTAPVGSFPPNAFGVHDVHGNCVAVGRGLLER